MIAEISPNELNVLATILSFYEHYLLRRAAPSAKRSRQITEIQFLQVKLQLLASAKAAVFTFEVLDCIDAAMNIFSSQVRQKIPPSKNRDEILESCEGLRAYLAKTFASLRNKTHD
jgi:hypothetical protein